MKKILFIAAALLLISACTQGAGNLYVLSTVLDNNSTQTTDTK